MLLNLISIKAIALTVDSQTNNKLATIITYADVQISFKLTFEN